MRAKSLLLAGLIVLLAAAPGASARQAAATRPCEQHDDLPRHTARATNDLGWDRVHSAVRICNRRTGVERVLREDVIGQTGRLYGDASAAGGRVAWIEAIRRRGRRLATVHVVVARIATRRVLRRRVVSREADVLPYDEYGLSNIGVALTEGGRLAWLVNRRVVLERTGRASQTIARDAGVPLDVEDGHTLVWRAFERTFNRTREGIGHRDLRPPMVRGGCPVRGLFAPAFPSAEVLPTLATYRRTEENVLRACLRSRGDDPVVGYARSFEGDGSRIEGITSGYWYVAFDVNAGSKYGDCEDEVVVVDMRTLARTTDVTLYCQYAPDHGPGRGEPFVVTSSGVPAWVSSRPSRPEQRLLAIGADKSLVELDRGSEIRDLRAEGEEVVWTNGGEARRARP